MFRETKQLDTSIEIVTPENIAFRYRVAGPFRRLPAYLIDLKIRIGVCFFGWIILMIVFSILGWPSGGIGAALILCFVVFTFYGGLFEAYWNGQTPGKRLMQIRVVTVDGQPINASQAVLRNILRIVDMQPLFFYLVGLQAASANDRFQRLGDLACGTMVVLEERQWYRGVLRTNDPEAIRLAGLVPASFQAGRELSRALAAYVHRRRAFSWGRRFEIAHHLGEPLRERFNLPADTNLDLLLCGLYHRTFITDRQEEAVEAAILESPFAPMRSPFTEPATAMASLDHGADEGRSLIAMEKLGGSRP